MPGLPFTFIITLLSPFGRYPPNSQSLGVEADDFTVGRSKSDLVSIFSAVEGATPDLLEQAWALGHRRRGVVDQDRLKMSLLEFRSLFNEVSRGY